MLNKRVFLIGFMGSGKSTVAKRLARELKYHAYDLDLELELRLHQKVADIFSAHGESYFRHHEQLQLHRSIDKEHMVIAVGGGTPCFFDNMEWMKSNGICIYLKMPPRSLVNRLSNAKLKRPLLDGMDTEQMLTFIESKLAEREKFYTEAHLTVDGHHVDVKTLAEQIRNFDR